MKFKQIFFISFCIFLFSCSGKSLNFSVIVSSPPEYHFKNGGVSLHENGREGDALVYLVKATLFSSANDVAIKTSEVSCEVGKDAIISFSGLSEATNVYAYIEVGFENGAEFKLLYSGCSDLFDIKNGATQKIAIVAVQNNSFGFYYKDKDDSRKFKVLTGNNSRNATFNDINLSDKKVKFTTTITTKAGKEDKELSLDLFKGTVVDNYFYGVCVADEKTQGMMYSSTEPRYYFCKIALDSLDNEMQLNAGEFGGLEIHEFIKWKGFPVRVDIGDVLFCQNYAYFRLTYNELDDNNVPIGEYPVVYVCDLSANANKDGLKIINFNGNYGSKWTGGYELKDYSFPISNGENLYLATYEFSNKGISLLFYIAPSSGATSTEKMPLTINRSEFGSNKISSNRPLHLLTKENLVLFAGPFWATINKEELFSNLANGNVGSTQQNCGQFISDELFEKEGLNKSIDKVYDFSALVGYKVGDRYYALYKDYGLFLFDGLNSGNINLVKKYLILDLHYGYIRSNVLYAFSTNKNDETALYSFKKDLNTITSYGKVPMAFGVTGPDVDGVFDMYIYDNFSKSVTAKGVGTYTQRNDEGNLLSTTDVFTTANNESGDNFIKLSFEKEKGELDINIVLSYDGWDESEPVSCKGDIPY